MARPPHKPTEEQKKLALTFSGHGIPHEQIAAEIGVSLPTLYKHYRSELDRGLRRANSLVVQSLFDKATSKGPQAVTAAIWWTKARMGWSEKAAVELTGKDGGPVQIEAEEKATQALTQIMGQIAAAKASLH